MRLAAVIEHGPKLGIDATCSAFGVARSTYFRNRTPIYGPRRRRPAPVRKLASSERKAVLDVLHEPRFVDSAPAQVHAALLAEGRYLASVRTMHRILSENMEAKERRDLARHRVYERPELLATAPNQLWSWDITKLKGPAKWTYFHLYVILDVFSRYVVGWMIAPRESANLAKRLIAETCRRQGIKQSQLTLHADRGSSMKSKTVALLLADLGVTKTHSRPHISDDNPFSEAQFKTMKYRPGFPNTFGCIQDGRVHFIDFFDWYNEEHHHSGLAMFTPAEVHYGLVEERLIAKQAVMDTAFAAHPERFPHGRPVVKRPNTEVWINPPRPTSAAQLSEDAGSSGSQEVRS
jgi:putative transposase